MIEKELDNWVQDRISEIESFINSIEKSECKSFKLGKRDINYYPYRTTSRGGMYKTDGIWTPGIDISLYSTISNNNNIIRFYEYPSYDHHPLIGGFFTTDKRQKILAIICHEMAHAIQRWTEYYTRPKTISKPHGILFKKYYLEFRQRYVNYNLQNQVILKEKYKCVD